VSDILLASDPVFLEHRPHVGHPEHESRLEVLADLPRLAALQRIPVRFAEIDELSRIHRLDYIDRVRLVAESGGGYLCPETSISPGSWSAALAAAGASIDLCHALLDGRARAGVALVRPPGHHATVDHAMGFCVFNNIALAADLAARQGRKVAVLDWDVHHGNGTQAAFWDRDDVLFLSVHQAPLYPWSGASGDVGVRRGFGYTRNVPLGPGCRDEDYLHVMDRIFAPRLAEFGPDIVMVSAGYDAHKEDPLAGMALDSEAYRQMTLRLMAAAAGAPVLVVLEGGYDLAALRQCVDLTVAALEKPEPPAAPAAEASSRVRQQVDRILETWRELGCP